MNENKKGSGFVQFKDHEHAQAALEATNKKKKITDQALLVSPHIYRKVNDLQKTRSGVSNAIVKN